jgi:hypothetical protein
VKTPFPMENEDCERISIEVDLYTNRTQQTPAHLFAAFWSMGLDSLYFPAQLYRESLDRLSKQADSSKDKEQERLRADLDRLAREQELFEARARDCEEKLRKRLPMADIFGRSVEGVMPSFVTECIVPRLTLDLTEAAFSARFLLKLLKIAKLSIKETVRQISRTAVNVAKWLGKASERQAENIVLFVESITEIFKGNEEQAREQFVALFGVTKEDYSKEVHEKVTRDARAMYTEILTDLTQCQESFFAKNGFQLIMQLPVPQNRAQAEILDQHIKACSSKFKDPDIETVLKRYSLILKKEFKQFENEEGKDKGDKKDSNKNESNDRA